MEGISTDVGITSVSACLGYVGAGLSLASVMVSKVLSNVMPLEGISFKFPSLAG